MSNSPTRYDAQPDGPGTPTIRGLILNDFTASMRRRGLTEGTIYGRLTIVRRWWDHVGDPFSQRVTWRHVERFVDASGTKVVGSRYNLVSNIHMFYVWAQRAEHIRHDPTMLAERPRLPRYLPRPAHDTDLALGLTLARGPMLAAIMLAASSGLRCVELARLQWTDVDATSLRVTGKGSKDRVVPLHPNARDALERLDRPDTFVLPWRSNRQDRPGWYVSQSINGFFRSIGCTTTAHQLRHWCATQALAATGDLRAVQEMLGHASLSTTQIYTHLDFQHLAHVYDQAHPRARRRQD